MDCPLCKISLEKILLAGELDNHLQLSSLLMADWAVLFASQMDTELKDLALGYHKSIGKQILDSSSPPPRESRYEIEAGFDRECHPVSSASQALLQIQASIYESDYFGVDHSLHYLISTVGSEIVNWPRDVPSALLYWAVVASLNHSNYYASH